MGWRIRQCGSVAGCALLCILLRATHAHAGQSLLIYYADRGAVAIADVATLERTAAGQQCVFDAGGRSAAIWLELGGLLARSAPGEFDPGALRMKIVSPEGVSHLLDGRGGYLRDGDEIPRLMTTEAFGKLRELVATVMQGTGCKSPMIEGLALFGGHLPDFQGPLPQTCEATPAATRKAATLTRAQLDEFVSKGWEHLRAARKPLPRGARADSGGWRLDGCARIEYSVRERASGDLARGYQVFMRIEDGSLIGIAEVE